MTFDRLSLCQFDCVPILCVRELKQHVRRSLRLLLMHNNKRLRQFFFLSLPFFLGHLFYPFRYPFTLHLCSIDHCLQGCP